MEYGTVDHVDHLSLAYMGAAPARLQKLDQVQNRAATLCGTTFQSLQGRREAVAYGMLCKQLDDDCVDPVKEWCPKIIKNINHNKRKRNSVKREYRLEPVINVHRKFSLETYKRSYVPQVVNVFDKLPNDIILEGMENGWNNIMKKGRKYLISQ